MSRKTITLDRKRLLAALARLDKALVNGNTEQTLQELHCVYALIAAVEAQRDTAG